MMKKVEINLKELLEAGCHFGHQAQRWHPKMKSYLFGVREGVHIFDLAKTKEGLEAACAFAKATASQAGKIIFLGTKRQAQEIVRQAALEVGMPYITERWMGGLLTNWEQVKKSIDKLNQMKKDRQAGEFKKYTKKEQLLLDREINRLEKFFGGLAELKEPPAGLLVVDIKKERAAVREASRMRVPVMALVDSNCDPTPIDWVIPANDDAVGSIKFVVEKIAQAVAEAQK